MELKLNMMTESVISGIVIMLASLSGAVFGLKKSGGLIERNLRYLVTFSTGVFLVIIWNLFEESIHLKSSFYMIFFGLIAGIVILEFGSKIIPEAHHHHEPESGHTHSSIDARRMLLGDAIHNIGDGILLVPAFLVNFYVGVATVVAIFFHELVQEISEFFVLREAGYTYKQALFRNFAVSATIFIGIILSLILSSAEKFIPFFLSFASGGFIYIILRDLIPNTFKSIKNRGGGLKHILAAILGILVMSAVGLVFPH